MLAIPAESFMTREDCLHVFLLEGGCRIFGIQSLIKPIKFSQMFERIDIGK
jgi:hypothetical protein